MQYTSVWTVLLVLISGEISSRSEIHQKRQPKKIFVPPKKAAKREKSEKEKQPKTLNGKAINEILEILFKLNDMKYLEEFFYQHKPLITPINCRLFVKLIVQFGYESIKHLLNLVVNPTLEDLIQNCHFIMVNNTS